jgi:predicted Holliday junction resolvase-like endonuclease
MLKMLLYGLLIWFLYNLIFRFVIPVYKTTRQMKQKFREMQTQMQDQMNKQQDFTAQQHSPEKSTSQKTKEDYIDFEEIK